MEAAGQRAAVAERERRNPLVIHFPTTAEVTVGQEEGAIVVRVESAGLSGEVIRGAMEAYNRQLPSVARRLDQAYPPAEAVSEEATTTDDRATELPWDQLVGNDVGVNDGGQDTAELPPTGCVYPRAHSPGGQTVSHYNMYHRFADLADAVDARGGCMVRDGCCPDPSCGCRDTIRRGGLVPSDDGWDAEADP